MIWGLSRNSPMNLSRTSYKEENEQRVKQEEEEVIILVVTDEGISDRQNDS